MPNGRGETPESVRRKRLAKLWTRIHEASKGKKGEVLISKDKLLGWMLAEWGIRRITAEEYLDVWVLAGRIEVNAGLVQLLEEEEKDV